MKRTMLFSLVASLAACAAPGEPDVSTSEPELLEAELQDTPAVESDAMTESPPEPPREVAKPDQPAYRIAPDGIAGLPGADGKTFAVLDDYLAHLESKGAYDRPFWELMEDGRYRWNTGRGMQFKEPKYATREELEAEYGFAQLAEKPAK